jgi:tetratricopeptide (TPR) repeat protein
MIDNTLSRVDILIQQKKFAAAEQILKDLLAKDANNIQFQALLAEVMLQQDKFAAAESIIDNAIGLSPDSAHLFYIKSRIAIQRDDLAGAEKIIGQAIQLDPYDADYYALLANIKLAQKQYQEALELADRSLEIDAENLLGLNTRSTALLKLNKSEESFSTIEGALREDPNNAYTHANYGWGLLEKGSHKKALEHFKESLKQNPNYDYAQAGMVEALKASNPVYRMFLKYAFWMGNLTSKYQWAVIIGFYVGMRVLRGIARSNEALQPFLTPLIILLALIAFSTWVINPVSNLFLRFNAYGKFLLDRNEKRSANFVAASFAICLTGILLYFILTDEKFLTLAVFGFAMMLPLSVMFSPAKYKYALVVYAAAMAVTGILAIGLTFATGEMLNSVTPIFIIGFVAFQWVANYLMIKEDNA